MKREKQAGEESFNQYYSELFGERWNFIKESFQSESDYCAINNPYANSKRAFQNTQCTPDETQPDDNPSIQTKANVSEEKYYIDTASVMCAGCLPVDNAENILDMCAAPGGKTLVIASRMGENATLLANERSKDRYCRLSNVIKTFLPESINSRITLSCADGSVLCRNEKYRERFDSILLDAPCSSERHVYNDSKYLSQWTKNRVKNLAMAQWALLSSGFLMLKKNGYILYSTCALADDENDGVISRLLKKYDSAEILEIDIKERKNELLNRFVWLDHLPDTERTHYGYKIMPDVSNGAGPIYFCLVKKI